MKKNHITPAAVMTMLAMLPAMAAAQGTNTPGTTSPSPSVTDGSSSTGQSSTAPSAPTPNNRDQIQNNNNRPPSSPPTLGQRLDNGIDRANRAIERTGENVRDLMSERTSSGGYSTVNVNPSSSVTGIIGQDVYDTSNRKVATVDDILFDSQGNASRVVLSNGGIMGVGAKLVVLDFERVYTPSSGKNIIAPISEDTIRQMTEYSSDLKDARDGMQTMGANEISAKAMLDGQLLNDRGNEIGSIENITIGDRKADQVIVAYDTTLGMGGKKIAVDYSRLQRVGDSTEVDFKLPSDLVARYETYTKPGPTSSNR